MTTQLNLLRSEKGMALLYVAAGLLTILLFSGLALDLGRSYIVKAQLTKAVDGAALGAARMLNSGDPEGEATRIFNANFPLGFMGTTAVSNPPGFTLETIAATGVNVITVTGWAVVPTTFMSLADRETVRVTSTGEATRRMVDLSLVLDVSSSIGGRWDAVRDAARVFVQSFDEANDRFSLITYSDGSKVIEEMNAARGFNKTKIVNDIPQSLPGGSTAMVEGLYHGWDELRTVPRGQQSSLRVIVLFTDGASNSVPGIYPQTGGVATGLRTYDFPHNEPDPDRQTHQRPRIVGLFDTWYGTQNPKHSKEVDWDSRETLAAPYDVLPATSTHAHSRSSGIPTEFPLQSDTLEVNGTVQSAVRGLRNPVGGVYPADVWNINNAARNLLEIIASAARNDDGAYRVRIFTIGMGELVRYDLGTMPEKPEQILMRIANDRRSADFNAAELEGKYYFAQTADDVGPAFQALQNQIIRLTK